MCKKLQNYRYSLLVVVSSILIIGCVCQSISLATDLGSPIGVIIPPDSVNTETSTISNSASTLTEKTDIYMTSTPLPLLPTSTREDIHAETPTSQMPTATNEPSVQPDLTAKPTATTNSPFMLSSSFETGDLSEWFEKGDFVRQGSGTYTIVHDISHSGSYSAALTIDTRVSSQSGSHASYLFFWEELPEDEYYFSSWYYIPSEIEPGDWWNIWQWKSTYDGNSAASLPVYSLGIRQYDGVKRIYLAYRADSPYKIYYENNQIPIPVDEWFHIEAYYRLAEDQTGQIIVWQNGVEIFNVKGYPTTLSNYKIYWSINNYTDSISPNPCTIYVDDVQISLQRIGD